MFKKALAITLSIAMLLCIGSPVCAAQEDEIPQSDAVETRTMKEILNDYHSKILELEIQPAASTYSRSVQTTGSVTQDAINELQDAGYEAYHVNSDTYAAVEAELQTSLSDLNLDKEGSYIVVISSEDQNTNDEIAPANDALLPPHVEGGGGDGFSYTYNGVIYQMRYITITSSASNGTQISSTYTVASNFWLEEGIMDIANIYLVAAADNLTKKLSLGTVFSLLGDWATNGNYTELDPGDLTIHAATAWTADVIQVYNSSTGRWINAQCSAYAVSKAKLAGYTFDSNTGLPTWHDGKENSILNNSPLYSAVATRKRNAIRAYLAGNISYDRTGDVCFFFETTDGEVIYDSNGDPLFTHIDLWTIT